MQISYFCPSCKSPATKICVHSSCQSSPFVCSQECIHLHAHPDTKLQPIQMVLDFASALRYQNVFYSVKLFKDKLDLIHQSLDDLLKKYENQLISAGNKPSPQIQKIVEKILEHSQNPPLKGKDLHRLYQIGHKQEQLVLEIKNQIDDIFLKPLQQLQKFDFQKITALNLESSRVEYQKARKLDQDGEVQKALKYYISAYKKNFVEPEIIFHTAMCMKSLKMWDKAYELFVRAVMKDKKGKLLSQAYNQIGEIQLERKNLKEAINCFRKAHAVESDPEKEALYLYNKARAYRANKDYQLAIEDLNNAIETFETPEYIDLLKQVQEEFRTCQSTVKSTLKNESDYQTTHERSLDKQNDGNRSK